MTKQSSQPLHPQRCCHYDVCYVMRQLKNVCYAEQNLPCCNYHTSASSPQRIEQVKLLPLLEKLKIAFHEYEMDVSDYDFPAPPKHRRMMEELDKAIALLREGEL